ncbi:hypothetical protein ACI1UM_10610 [Lactococcus petauri]|uniref:hypothetical protein n=1 Tax=Lactococcus petauri TaxID=1940789 RepID=UPI0038519E95
MKKKTIITIAISVAATLIIGFFAIAFYGMSLNSAAIKGSEAATLVEKGESLKGKVIEVHVDSVDTDSTNTIVLSDDSAEKIVYTPNNQQEARTIKAGDTVKAKVTNETNVLGYLVVNADIEK